MNKLQKLNTWMTPKMPLLILCSLALGLLFPNQIGVLCPAVSALMMFQTFANSLGSSVQDLGHVFSHPKPVLVTMLTLHILMPLLALAVSFLISFGVTFALNMPNMTLPLFLLLLVVTLFYPKYGKSEMNNKNANTSGVVALLEVAKALTPRYRGEVCFLFLDGGTQGSKGAKRLIHAHPELKKKSVVVLDCVGEGDELLILPGKASRWNDKLLDTILEQFSNSERKTCFLKTDGLVHYPSDNRAFTGGTVICACKKVKGFGRCILPRKATGIDEENLSLLCDGLCKLVMYYNPQNT